MSLAEALAAEVAGVTTRVEFGRQRADVPLRSWYDAALAAKNTLGCLMFDWLGVEDAGRPGAVGERYAVTLHVVHPGERVGMLMRTELPAGETLPSVAAVWAGAAWHEREAAEMFGIELSGHPDPRRLLLPDSFTGHPLRKDFVLAARVVRPWPGGLEPGEADTSAPSRRRLAPPGVPGPEWGPRREEPQR